MADISKHRDSKNDWRGSCETKMNNLEFPRLFTNSDFRGSNVMLRFLSVGTGNLKLTKVCRLE